MAWPTAGSALMPAGARLRNRDGTASFATHVEWPWLVVPALSSDGYDGTVGRAFLLQCRPMRGPAHRGLRGRAAAPVAAASRASVGAARAIAPGGDGSTPPRSH